jgi:signal transduction histidine kinase
MCIEATRMSRSGGRRPSTVFQNLVENAVHYSKGAAGWI